MLQKPTNMTTHAATGSRMTSACNRRARQRGYTTVDGDLPGVGASSGCWNNGGPTEQTAVKSSVEWAASQPWSSGKVAMVGTSYDGWTGIMGLATNPRGLAAVVSLAPV